MGKGKRSRQYNGLTWQEEKFCHCYVNQYANLGEDGSDDSEVAMVAYRMAYNCKSDALEKTHKDKGRELLKKAAIGARIKEIRSEVAKFVDIECADIVSRNVKALNVDPLDLTIFDKKINKRRLRYMSEIPKHIRDVIPYKINKNGIVVPDIDRNKIMDRLINMLGFNAPKDVNVKMEGGTLNEILIGYDDDDIWQNESNE